MKKHRHKLRRQVMWTMAALYAVGTVLLLMLFLNSNVNSFLSSKEDMMQRDIEMIENNIDGMCGSRWYFGYAKEHPDEVKKTLSDEEMQDETITDIYSRINGMEPKEQTAYLESLPADQQLLFARDIHMIMPVVIESTYEFYGYRELTVMDISAVPDSREAFIYYGISNEKDSGSRDEYELGDTCLYGIDNDPQIKSLIDGSSEKIEYKNVVSGKSKFLDAFRPVSVNDEAAAVIYLSYDYTEFYNSLMKRMLMLVGIMLAGILIVSAVTITMINRIAIRPLTKLSRSVKEYSSHRDGDKMREELDGIKSGNEIGQLSSNIYEMTREIDKHVGEIKALSVEIMEALAQTIDAKDKYTNGHSFRVAVYSRSLAKRLGLSSKEAQDIYYMGLLHDIGKIGIPDTIINKDSKLTDEEYALIKTHPVKGHEILSQIKSMPELSIGALYHHERYDGKGYPEGLAGEDIPFFARIIAVADTYDSMTSNRSYRKYLPQEVAREEIEKNAGTQFDPDVAKAMLEMIDIDKHYMLHE